MLRIARKHIEQGAFKEAYAMLHTQQRRFLDDAEFWLLYGIALQFVGLTEAAEAAFRHLRAIDPTAADVQARHGRLMAECGDLGAARTRLWATMTQSPATTESLVAAARVAEVFEDTSTATKAYETVLANNPRHVESLTNLGNIKKKNGELDQAEQLYRAGLAANPNSAILHRNLSDLIARTFRTGDAIEELEKCVSLAPQNPAFLSDLIFARHHTDEHTIDDLSQNALAWGAKFGTPNSAPFRQTKKQTGVLRVGLLSGSFHQHPVGFLALAGLERLPPNRFSIICYANQTHSDVYTDRFKTMCHRWRCVAHLSDSQLQRVMIEDDLDILIEMSGHASGNRLPVVARRVAPVQIKWIGGQFNTTGIKAIDFFLSDSIESPPDQDAHFCEDIYRLPECYACYEPPDNAPDVSPLPALENGFVTFG